MTSRTHVSQMPKKTLRTDWLNKEKGPFTQWLHCTPTALITEDSQARPGPRWSPCGVKEYWYDYRQQTEGKSLGCVLEWGEIKCSQNNKRQPYMSQTWTWFQAEW